jgi:hypothetical protein
MFKLQYSSKNIIYLKTSFKNVSLDLNNNEESMKLFFMKLWFCKKSIDYNESIILDNNDDLIFKVL